MKIVSISDTHGLHSKLIIPECDILIHCGDFCYKSTKSEVNRFVSWLLDQPAKYKIVVPGNHDKPCEQDKGLFYKYVNYHENKNKNDVHFLIDRQIEIEGIKIFGSPITPRLGLWSFMYDRCSQTLKNHWNKIPENIDILITHGPPFGYCDKNDMNYNVGCELLLEKIKKVRPKYNFFGHIHESHGMLMSDFGTMFVNCSQPCVQFNSPIVINY